MKVTVNKCKSMLRAKYREELPLTEDISYLPPEESVVLEAVLSLDEKYRLPIHLHYYEGYSQEEIAKILGITRTAVQTRMQRARTMLEKELKIP